jgi:hypothetical protein
LMSITLSPLNSTVPLGNSPQFTATGHYVNGTMADITADVTWTSSATGVATISNAMGSIGRVTTLTTGMTMITAALGTVTATTNLTVSAATLMSITISPANIKIAKTTKLQLQAFGTFTDMTMVDLTTSVSWGSGNNAFATVSNAPGEAGQVLGVAAGTTNITATSGMIVGTTPITVTNATITSMAVTPATPMVPAGGNLLFTATGTFFDAMTMETTTQNLNLQATWASSDITKATISNAADTSRGLATTLAMGPTTISAVFGGVSGSTTLTVTMATLSSIVVSPTTRTIAKGTTQQFTATAVFSDNTTQDVTGMATWSSDGTVVSVNMAGLATGLTPGRVFVVASFGGRMGAGVLIVTDAVIQSLVVRGAPLPLATPDPAVSIPNGTTHQFYAAGTFSDMTVQDLTTQVTWASSNLGQATIDSTGLARAVADPMTAFPVTPSVTAVFRDATTNNTVAASRMFTITGETLMSITVAPASPTIAAGIVTQLTAQGLYSDGITRDITASVSWSSMTPGVAGVNDMAPDKGEVTGVMMGTSVITANLGMISGTTTVTVSAAVLTGLVITGPAMMANNATANFTVVGTLSDMTMTGDLTDQVTWASSSPEFATISNGVTPAVATSGAMDGTTTISVLLNGRIAQVMLIVQ